MRGLHVSCCLALGDRGGVFHGLVIQLGEITGEQVLVLLTIYLNSAVLIDSQSFISSTHGIELIVP